jgi:predicted YcjX-like family ATPase
MTAGEDLARLYGETKTSTDALHAKAAEILEMAKQLEHLTKDTPAWYATTRAKVEARAALEQAEELRRALEELGKWFGE